MQVASFEESVELVDDLFARTNRATSCGFGEDFFECADGERGVHGRIAWADDAHLLSFIEACFEQEFDTVVEGLDLGCEGGIEAWSEREEQLGEGRIVKKNRDDSSDVVLDLRFDVGVRIDLKDGGSEAREETVDEFDEHGTFVREVQVERALRDACFGHDVVDFCRVVPLRREHISCSAQQFDSSLRLVHEGAFYHLWLRVRLFYRYFLPKQRNVTTVLT